MRKNLLSISNSDYTSLIIVFYYVFFLIRLNFNNSSLFPIIGMGISFLAVLRIKNFIKLDLYIISLILVMYFMLLVGTLYTNNLGISDILAPIQYIFLTFALIKYKLNYKIISISFYIHVIYFLYHIVIGTDPNILFVGNSRNTVSSLMIIQCILLYISFTQNEVKIKLLPALITLLISAWGLGRSGLISSLIILLGLIICELFFKKVKIKIVFSIGFIILTSIIFINFYEDYFSPIIDRFNNSSINDIGRSEIINEYIGNLNAASLFFGVPLKNNVIFDYYKGNLHNSYLFLHSNYGLWGMIIIIVLIVIKSFNYIKDKNFLYFILLLAVIVRISTDRLAFYGIYDPIIFYFLLDYSFKKNKRNDLSPN